MVLSTDTTPPKKRITDMSQDFYSAGFVPGAIVYFACGALKGEYVFCWCALFLWKNDIHNCIATELYILSYYLQAVSSVMHHSITHQNFIFRFIFFRWWRCFTLRTLPSRGRNVLVRFRIDLRASRIHPAYTWGVCLRGPISWYGTKTGWQKEDQAKVVENVKTVISCFTWTISADMVDNLLCCVLFLFKFIVSCIVIS